MVINENTIKQLATAFDFESFKEEHRIEIDNVTYKVDFNKEDDKLVLTLTKQEDTKLKDFVNSLDDDLFQTACEEVETFTGRTLGDWNENSTQDEILEMFKALVKRTIEKEKSDLQYRLNKLTKTYSDILKDEE